MTFKNLPNQPKVEAYLLDGKVVDGDTKGAEKVQLDKWSIGAMKGFEMALQDLAAQGYHPEFRDQFTITCTAMQENDDPLLSDMVMFKVTPTRV